jgi:hypothetical protein
MCFNLTFRDLVKGFLSFKTGLKGVSLERRGRLGGGY